MNADERQAALDRARGGDAQALGDLLESYRPYVRAMTRRLGTVRLQSRVGNSDLVQDALLEGLRGFAEFRGTTVPELLAWLREIVRHTAGKALREHLGAAKRNLAREQPVSGLSSVLSDGSTPSNQAIRHEQAARMAEAVARLPEDMQQVLLGRYVDDLSHADLAAKLGRSAGAVRVLCVRALQRLGEVYRD